MFEFFFKYPASVFRDSQLILANDWPLWLFWLALITASAALIASLFLRRNTLSPLQNVTTTALQLLMLALVLVVLWQPALVRERLVEGENGLLVLLDSSTSMTQRDEGQSRMAQARSLLQSPALQDIQTLYQTHAYAFAGTLTPLEPALHLEDLPEPEPATLLGSQVLDALRQHSNLALGAVIVLSDGSDNRGALPQNELSEIARFGVPVHTLGLGRERMPEDLELEAVDLPSQALPGTTLTARVRIRHDQGGSATLKTYDGERLLSTRQVPLNANDSSTLAYVDIETERPGQMDLRFTLDPIAGERHLANNSRSHVVNVRENRYRILYVEGEPRWDYKFIRRALTADPTLQLSTLLRVSTNKFYRQGIEDPEELADGFPKERSELFQYDALIIGSFEAAELTQAQQAMIRDFVNERGGSLLMLGGLRGLGQGGWETSVVNDILPTRLGQDNSAFVREQVPVRLSAAGRQSPLLQFSSDPQENVRQWQEMPHLADYQRIGPLRPAARTLLEYELDGRHLPLLVTQPYGRGHSYVLASGGTWRWQMNLPHEDQRHETFWRQLARALVANAPRPFEIDAIPEGAELRLRAQVRDPEADANQGLNMTALVSTPDDDLLSLELLPVAGRPGTWEASFTPPVTGLFSIEAISRRGDEPVASALTATRFEQGDEDFAIRQNRALLETLSASTGGRYWTASQWNELLDDLRYATTGITELERRLLWDAPIVFLLLFLLKALEWLLRRRWRTI